MKTGQQQPHLSDIVRHLVSNEEELNATLAKRFGLEARAHTRARTSTPASIPGSRRPSLQDGGWEGKSSEGERERQVREKEREREKDDTQF